MPVRPLSPGEGGVSPYLDVVAGIRSPIGGKVYIVLVKPIGPIVVETGYGITYLVSGIRYFKGVAAATAGYRSKIDGSGARDNQGLIKGADVLEGSTATA